MLCRICNARTRFPFKLYWLACVYGLLCMILSRVFENHGSTDIGVQFIITSCSADLNTGVIFVIFSFTGNTPNLIAVSTICNSGTFISSYTDIIAFTCILSDPVSWHFKESQAPLNSYFLSIFSSRKASDLVK